MYSVPKASEDQRSAGFESPRGGATCTGSVHKVVARLSESRRSLPHEEPDMLQARQVPLQNEKRTSTVYVIDDDESMRRSLSGLLRSDGLRVETFSSPGEFLGFSKPKVPSCLILDVRLRGENGLTFQETLAKNGPRMPIVFIRGYGDIEMSVKAMKAGALDFFPKPFREQDMLDAVAHALACDTERLAAEESLALLRASYKSLTERERVTVGHVAEGLMNKQIAAQMNLSEVTVKTHRANAMRKMAARSVADLVRKIDALGLDGELDSSGGRVWQTW